jgi:uncharacterized membrane protein YphA (DoxX/SURF4 family)
MPNNLLIILILAVMLNMLQFLYSGVNKIRKFSSKVNTLEKKVDYIFPKWLCEMGMGGVIILEIVGSIILIIAICCLNSNLSVKKQKIIKYISIITIILFILFIIVATIIYHPPSPQKMIPFLSNLSVIGGFGFLLYILLENY